MTFWFFFFLIIIFLLLFIYFLFIFYDELGYKSNTYIVEFDIKVLNRSNFLKGNNTYLFSIEINVCRVISRFFNSLNILNIAAGAYINLFSRPCINLRLFYFYLAYNLFACYIICCVTWAFAWRDLSIVSDFYASVLPDNYDAVIKTSSFFMFLLITTDFLILALILCFICWKYEYTVLIPLNLLILLFYFYCFLFNFFVKFFAHFIYFLVNSLALFVLNLTRYPFKNLSYINSIYVINFFNHLWIWLKYAVWDRSSIYIKIYIYLCMVITFSLAFFYSFSLIFSFVIFS